MTKRDHRGRKYGWTQVRGSGLLRNFRLAEEHFAQPVKTAGGVILLLRNFRLAEEHFLSASRFSASSFDDY